MTVSLTLDTRVHHALPDDHARATLVGRAYVPAVAGPAVILVRGDDVFDITRAFPTMRDLCESETRGVADAAGERLCALDELLANTPRTTRDPQRPWLLAPIDLQAIKASGVTFATSLLERVIEEQARGSAERAAGVRAEIQAVLGSELASLVPGSPAAAALKDALVARGLWSQYLEVGIGPDAEVFTKAQPMSAVGHLAEVGIHPRSTWNNPEPEVVLVVSSTGAIVGATLGNDVNLRDFEGRSALLLGRAKDNAGSAALGPFIRLFDDGFALDDIMAADIALHVDGPDGFALDGNSSMRLISRTARDLVDQTAGKTHQYPDGFVLYLGTMFAPIQDRGVAGSGFTHVLGDRVTVASPRLGRLQNLVAHSTDVEPWTFGASALMKNLARRGLI